MLYKMDFYTRLQMRLAMIYEIINIIINQAK